MRETPEDAYRRGRERALAESALIVHRALCEVLDNKPRGISRLWRRRSDIDLLEAAMRRISELRRRECRGPASSPLALIIALDYVAGGNGANVPPAMWNSGAAADVRNNFRDLGLISETEDGSESATPLLREWIGRILATPLIEDRRP